MTKDLKTINGNMVRDNNSGSSLTNILRSVIYTPTTDGMKLVLENLNAITEFYKEWREGKKIELAHERAIKQIEFEYKQWEKVFENRAKRMEIQHTTLKSEIEASDNIDYKLKLFYLWSESLKQPLVLKQELQKSSE